MYFLRFHLHDYRAKIRYPCTRDNYIKSKPPKQKEALDAC